MVYYSGDHNNDYNNNRYYNKYYNSYSKNYRKNYSSKRWIYMFNSIINLLLILGSIINIIIFVFYGLEVAGLIAFALFTTIGISKLIIRIIKYINNIYYIWNN